jgi:hypothetical protein
MSQSSEPNISYNYSNPPHVNGLAGFIKFDFVKWLTEELLSSEGL